MQCGPRQAQRYDCRLGGYVVLWGESVLDQEPLPARHWVGAPLACFAPPRWPRLRVLTIISAALDPSEWLDQDLSRVRGSPG